jgi:uncharacterized protein YeaO (DUF488 family)
LTIQLKGAREDAARSDGYRILVDRVWPRGVSKGRLQLDDWAKDVAPSTELRKWFNHDRERWEEFRRRYFRELDDRPEAIGGLIERARRQTVTLVFGARDTRFNNAVALKEYLERKGARGNSE